MSSVVVSLVILGRCFTSANGSTSLMFITRLFFGIIYTLWLSPGYCHFYSTPTRPQIIYILSFVLWFNTLLMTLMFASTSCPHVTFQLLFNWVMATRKLVPSKTSTWFQLVLWRWSFTLKLFLIVIFWNFFSCPSGVDSLSSNWSFWAWYLTACLAWSNRGL